MGQLKKILTFFLCLLLIVPTIGITSTEAATLSDVPTSSWNYQYINWAVDHGYLQTNANAQFQPNQTVTSNELLTTIAKMDENYSLSYSINQVRSYYADRNIPMFGSGDSKVTRGQFARIYAALNGFDLQTQQAVQNLYVSGITNGTEGNKTYAAFSPNSDITKAQLAVFLYRIDQFDGISSIGLSSRPTGKDNATITLPQNFVGNQGTVEYEQPSTGSTTNLPSTVGGGEVNAVTNETDGDLIANGSEPQLVTLQLRDRHGGTIPYDTSLKFVANSALNAPIASQKNKAGNRKQELYTDGGELNFFVTPPASTRDRTDTLTFELQGNTDARYRNLRKFTVKLDYVSKPEIRVGYDVVIPTEIDEDTTPEGSIISKEEEELIAEGISYTKVFTTVHRAGGAYDRSFNGTVDITFNGETRSVKFVNSMATAIYEEVVPGVTKATVNASSTNLSTSKKKEYSEVLDRDITVDVFNENQSFAPNKCTRTTEVAYVVDHSGSMIKNDPNNYVSTITKKLIRQMNANPSIAVRFNNEAYLDGNGEATTVADDARVFNPDNIRGGTNIAKGLNLGISKFTNDNTTSKAIILVSDGKSGKPNIDDAKVQSLGIKIFTIGVGKNVNSTMLKSISDQTGGQYFHISQIEHLHTVYQSIIDAILCDEIIQASSCVQGQTVFEQMEITYSPSFRSMMAIANSSCMNEIKYVTVRYYADNGEYDFNLQYVNQRIFRLREPEIIFSSINLIDKIEFLAYDKDMRLIGVEQYKPD